MESKNFYDEEYLPNFENLSRNEKLYRLMEIQHQIALQKISSMLNRSIWTYIPLTSARRSYFKEQGRFLKAYKKAEKLEKMFINSNLSQ